MASPNNSLRQESGLPIRGEGERESWWSDVGDGSEMHIERFKFETINDKIVIRFGNIALFDHQEVLRLRTRLLELMNSVESKTMIVNLGNVKMMTSETLNLLFSLHNQSHRLRLCNVLPDALEVLQLTRTVKLFDIFPNEKAALAA